MFFTEWSKCKILLFWNIYRISISISVPCVADSPTGWFGQRSKSVDSRKSRGNFCFKSFEKEQKTFDEMKNYCGRFSSNLITNEVLLNSNSTLKTELDFIFEKKLLTLQNHTH